MLVKKKKKQTQKIHKRFLNSSNHQNGNAEEHHTRIYLCSNFPCITTNTVRKLVLLPGPPRPLF